jgi:membrane protein DedA with SNARE-associated domain
MPTQTILDWVSQYGYLMIFFLLSLGIVGIPVPDETLLTFVGYLSFKRDLQIIPSIFAAALGSLCGITLSYVLGRTGGVSLINRYGHLFRMDKDRISRIQGWFDRMGKWALLIGYFIPGVRHLTAFMAGTYRLRYSTFALVAYAGGFLWSCSFISAGYFGGKEWDQLRGRVHEAFLLGSVILLILILVFYLWKKKFKRPTSEGNRPSS